MYKSKLQEYCQSKKWNLPEYSTTKEGLDHCPDFKASVVVNGSTFSTPHYCKSSKEAHNLVAHIAFNHFTGSSSASTAPTCTEVQQPKMNEPLPLQAISSNGLNCLDSGDKKFKDMSHLYKNQLQVYAQKRNLSLPVYTLEREGPPHVSRFKSKVMLEGKTYESLEYFSTVKDAENAAAKIALMSVSSDHGAGEEAPAVFKNLLQEFVQKEYSCLPAYVTSRSGLSHNLIFSSTVEINGESFTGLEAKTRKLAEMNAAKVAYTALTERKLKQSSAASSSGYQHVNDPLSSPTTQLTPATELTDRHISASNPVSDRVSVEQVSCNKVEYQQDTEAKHILEKPEFPTNSHQNLRGVKTDGPIQPSSRSGVGEISGASASPDASSSPKRIKVYPLTSNMTLPIGATVMHRDEKWVAVATADANV